MVHDVQDPQLPSPTIAVSTPSKNVFISAFIRAPSSAVRPMLRQNETSAPSARKLSAQISLTQSQDRHSMSTRNPIFRPARLPTSGPLPAMSSLNEDVGSRTLPMAISTPFLSVPRTIGGSVAVAE